MKAFRDIVLNEVSTILRRIDEQSSRAFVGELSRSKSIYITGVGRSGLVVQAFGQRLMHLGFDVHLAHEITAPAIRRGDLLVACSGTGTTLLPLYMARKARRMDRKRIPLKTAAKEMEISYYTLNAIVANTIREYPVDTLKRLCDYLECNIGDLLSYEEIK